MSRTAIQWCYMPVIGTVMHAIEETSAGWASLCGRPERHEETEVDDEHRCRRCLEIERERCSD